MLAARASTFRPRSRFAGGQRGAGHSKSTCRELSCRSLGDKLRELGDKFKEFEEKVKFENWAPKSSRAWRLRQTPNFDEANKDEADFSSSLDKRLRQMSEDSRTVAPSTDKEVGSDISESPVSYNDPSRDSFSDAGDGDIAKALASRIEGGSSSVDETSDEVLAAASADDEYLAAEELVDLIVGKYGKKYDLTIARRSFAGKDFVSLNVMWVHVDQRSFPMSLEQYMDKMDGISVLMNAWNRQTQVRAFFKEKPKSKNGMPARPIVGQAVPLQLDLPPEQVQEWIGSRLG